MKKKSGWDRNKESRDMINRLCVALLASKRLPLMERQSLADECNRNFLNAKSGPRKGLRDDPEFIAAALRLKKLGMKHEDIIEELEKETGKKTSRANLSVIFKRNK